MFDLNLLNSPQEYFYLSKFTERNAIANMLAELQFDTAMNLAIHNLADHFIVKARQTNTNFSINALLAEFKLSTDSGVALMCLAESLLRVPDKFTQLQLIKESLAAADWHNHTHCKNLFVSAASWSLLLIGKILTSSTASLWGNLTGLLANASSGMIISAMELAMQLLGKHFVIGKNITSALAKAHKLEASGYRCSFDMLGEAAVSHQDAARYFNWAWYL
jgi:RHH-type transcriptional regulator, proline utilization regulon repressor / proline dehydrogenase / delta 1-pyrroline-5-carboxylate dehydrogenase